MIVRTGHIYIGTGRTDKAPIVIIPILQDGRVINDLLLVHVEYNNALSVQEKRDVLGYRYYDIKNLLTEYNLPWSDTFLDAIPTAFLLGESIELVVAEIRKNLESRTPKHSLPNNSTFKIIPFDI